MYVGAPAYSVRVSRVADDAHRPPLRGFAAAAQFAPAARAAYEADTRTDGRTRHRFNMLTNACAVRATMNVYGDVAFGRVNEVGGVA